MSQPAGNTAAGVPQADWTRAFDARSQAAFSQAFASDVVLEATLITRPIEGRERVERAMAVMSNIYESLEFTHQATSGRRTYLEWTALALGGLQLKGVTVLVRDEQDRIATVAIHPSSTRASCSPNTPGSSSSTPSARTSSTTRRSARADAPGGLAGSPDCRRSWWSATRRCCCGSGRRRLSRNGRCGRS